ncbi:MAG: DUF188 domain-containing protein [Lachnospiraceae bacterium]
MKILIDGDGCPVIRMTEQIAIAAHIPVTIVVDYNHQIQSSYAQVVTVDQGNDSADFVLFGLIQKGDLIITQDYGVASLALSKGAYALHQSGREYTQDNIEQLLFERHLSKKQRNSKKKKHYTPIAKRTTEDDLHFQESLLALLKLHI